MTEEKLILPEILTVNPDWTVAVKPFGVLSEDAPDTPGMPALLRTALAERGAAFEDVYPVHRLDRTTEGLMVYALTKKGASALSRLVTEGKLTKIYTAYVSAPPDLPGEGEMRDRLFFDRKRDKAFVLPPDADRRGAKEAVLRYAVTDRFDWRGHPAARVRVELLTGRTHQIRAQFAARKAPLLGDGKYGSRVNRKGPSLFSAELAFPWEGREERFIRPAALPERQAGTE